MEMNVYYNREGIGDVLLIEIKNGEKHQFTYEKKEKVVKIVDQEKRTLGFNIYDASEFGLDIEQPGPVDTTQDLVERIQKVIQDHGFNDQLRVDLSPKFVVGEIIKTEGHPDADRLKVCEVNTGTERLSIVCGGPNAAKGQKVVVAKVGAIMPSGLVIKEASLRGVDSFGMICAARELDLKNAPQEKGILELPDTYQVGDEFVFEGKDFLEL
jgi:tRNA-binding protein